MLSLSPSSAPEFTCPFRLWAQSKHRAISMTSIPSVITSATSGKFVGEPLSSHNYSIWAFEFQLAAEAHNVWSIIDKTETIPAPTKENIKESKDFQLRHSLAKSQILKCVDQEMKMKLLDK